MHDKYWVLYWVLHILSLITYFVSINKCYLDVIIIFSRIDRIAVKRDERSKSIKKRRTKLWRSRMLREDRAMQCIFHTLFRPEEATHEDKEALEA